VHLTTACTYTNFEMLSHPFFCFLRRSFAKSDFFDVVVSQIGQAKVYKTLKAGKKISACKSLEEEICQIACYFFSLHSLRRSGDCHNIGSRLSLIWVCTRACVLLGKWAINFFRKTQTDEGQTCDRLALDGNVF